jgi:uncharacterized protein YjdB
MSIAVGGTQAFMAVGHYSDKTTKDLTTMATWTSSATATATVSATGVATGVAAGTATITATNAGIMGTATLTVTMTTPPPPMATLTSIAVTPANPMIAVPATQQFSVTGTYSDGSTKDLTGSATWASSMTGVATISATGLATAVAKGSTVITAMSNGMSASTGLTVTAPPVLKTITVTPANPTVAKGTSVQLTATGSYDDGTTKDLTATATWASMTPATATVSAAGLAMGVAGGMVTITATSGAVSGSTSLTVVTSDLISIAVTPDTPTIAVGTKQQFTATGTFKNSMTGATTTQDLTGMVTWSSDMVAKATISATGQATAVAVGSSVIKATSGTITGLTTLNVRAVALKSIAVTTPTASIAKGTTATFTATGTFEDNSTQNLTTQVTWTSSVPGTATIAATGVATSVAKGTTTITAAFMGVMGTLGLTVSDAVLTSIAVSADLPVPSATPSIARNTKVQMTAIGTFSDQTKQDLTDTVTWASSTAAVTISNAAASRGLATAGNAAGMSDISATIGTGATAISGKVTLKVTVANLVSIVITPATFSLAAGFNQQFIATGFFDDTSRQDLTETAAWSSDKVATATVSNVAGTKGLAHGVAAGSAVLTASVGNQNPITATAALTVKTALPQTIQISPATPGVALGTTTNLTAQCTFSDGSKQDFTNVVTWSSDKTNIATVSNAAGSNGKVTPVAKGTATITATFAVSATQNISGTAALTVSDALLKSIAVTAATSTTIEKGTTLQLTATGTFTDGTTANHTKAVTWSSSMTSLATVSNTAATAGLVTAVNTGAVTISATSTAPSQSNQPVVGTLALTINDGKLLSIAVTPATPSIAIGTKLQFVAIGTFNDGAKQDITGDVTWSSDAATKATVDAAGLAAGVAEGTANITATSGTGATAIAGSTKLTVKNVTLSSVVVTPNPTPPNSIAKGTTLQFKATGFFSDTTTQDLTDTATWSAAMPTIVSISNDPEDNGLATGTAVGMTTVKATVVIGATTVASTPVMLNVTVQTLVSVAITPSPASVAKGATLNLIATGTYTDGSTQVLTNTVTWSSATPATATVSNAANQHGRVTGVAVGMVEITATSNAASGSKVAKITVNVTPAAVASINVTVANATVAKTMTRQFTATATLTDGTKKDLSPTATWKSSDTAIATISATGLATGVAAGTTQISATADGINSNNVTLTVTN